MESPRTTSAAGTSITWARPLLALAFSLICAAGLATVVVAYRTTGVERLVTQNYELRRTLGIFFSDLQDAETGQRGFLLTDNPTYLEPFHRAEKSIPAALDHLSALIEQDPHLEVEVSDMRALVNAKFDELAQTIALEQQGQEGPALSIVTSNRGKALMDAIRRHVEEIARQNNDLLVLRQSEASTMRTSLAVMICLSLLCAIGLAGFLAREMLHALATAQARTVELEAEIKLRRETEETLRQAKKMEAVGQLTGGIAHDFNNLLTVITSNGEDIRDDVKDNPIVNEQMDILLEATNRGAKLVAQLMAFARKQELDPISVDINTFMDKLTRTLREAVPENIDVRIFKAAAVPLVDIDPRRLETAMLSIASNAQDAMPDGGILTIETSLKALDASDPAQRAAGRRDEYVLIAVTDTGAGMPKEVLESAFVPFFTTKEVGKGSGLGLSTVYGFVKQSGGNAQIYSEKGFGTVVKVYLPTGRSVVGPAAEAATAPQTAPQRGTVLIVEDDQAIRENTTRNLTRLGYAVTSARDAAEALEIITASPKFDVVFSDVIMPGRMNGSDLAREIRHRWPDVRVVLTSGYTQSTFEKLDLPKDVQFLSKPYSTVDLAVALS